MPRTAIFLDVDGARLGERGAEQEAADAGGDADAKMLVVMVLVMGGRRLNGAGQHGGGDSGGDEAGNDGALEHDDLLAALRGDPSAS